MLAHTSWLARFLLVVVTALAPFRATATETASDIRTLSQAELREFIISKLTYDRDYFDEILRLHSQGRVHARLTPVEFAAEVKRARANQPVLRTLFKELANPRADGMLSLPPTQDVHREYTNLFGLLNMMQANDRHDFREVLRQGGRLKVTRREDFGHVRGDSGHYYVNLYRLYFFLMAFAHYSLGQDGDAVEWLGRLEADANLAALKQRLGSVTTETGRALKLDVLRSKPLAVMPFAGNAADKDLAWAESALTELLTTDLVRSTDLVIVERTQLDKVMEEVALGAAGFVQDKVAKDVGKLVGAGSLLMGSFQRTGGGVLMHVRLVDSEDARVLASESGELKETELIAGARGLVLKLFGTLGWANGINDEELLAGQAPDVTTLKTLHQARLLRAAKPEQARELFARAVKEDPAVANLYRELRAQFQDVSATLAVMEISNLSGTDADAWMARGVVEGLTADLPRLDFRVVERDRLAEVMETRAEKQMLDPGSARKLGEQLGADFVVLGGLLHQKPRIRVDVRFVDVRTGVIAQSVTVENKTNDLMAVLAGLSNAIAAQFNRKLSPSEIESLAGRQRSAKDFEAFIRQELAQEALRASQPAAKAAPKAAPAAKPAPTLKPPSPLALARIGLYSVGAAVVVSAALAVLPASLAVLTGLLQAWSYGAQGYQFRGLRASAEDQGSRSTPGAKEMEALQQAQQWLGVAAAGGAVLGGAVSVIVVTAGALALERVVSSVVAAAGTMQAQPETASPAKSGT